MKTKSELDRMSAMELIYEFKHCGYVNTIEYVEYVEDIALRLWNMNEECDLDLLYDYDNAPDGSEEEAEILEKLLKEFE